jgi:hypothetical protein
MFSFLFLPTFLVRKVKSTFFKEDYPSDFKLNAPSLNWLLFRISRLEAFFVTRGYTPFGTSLICIARNK